MFTALLLAGAMLAQSQTVKAAPLPALKVSGITLTNVQDQKVWLRGIDVCSMEWTAAGDHVLQSINVATNGWHANIIRLPLSQDRWFGKTDDSSGSQEDAYHTLVDQAVAEAALDRAYIILDLHWSDMGVWGQNIGQHSLPDENSLAFWKAVAARYANRPNVVFDLYNEPIKAPWDVWRNGGTLTETFQGKDYTYTAVGLQQLLDAIRAVGAKNVVLAGGLGYSSQLDMPDSDLLSDPHGNGVLLGKTHGDCFQAFPHYRLGVRRRPEKSAKRKSGHTSRACAEYFAETRLELVCLVYAHSRKPVFDQ
jgi:hypothetical protein